MALYVDADYVEAGYTQTGVTAIWGTKTIFVPKTSMLLVQSTPVEIRQLDLTEFRYALHDLQDDEQGVVHDRIHSHNFEVTVSGVVLSQVVEIINDYSVTFEDGLYNVNIVGGNSNISDRVNKNQVGVNTSNSAGLQNIATITSVAYSNGVYLNQANGQAGTAIPIGTQGTPSSNFVQAKAIANSQNTNTIAITSPTTLTTGDDASSMTIVGTNPVSSILVVEDGAVMSDVYIKELYFNGILDGSATIRDCVVGQIQYFSGYIEHCALTSNTIAVNGIGVFLNCVSGPTCISPPVLDLLNATGLGIRNYGGDLCITNKVGAGNCRINMDGILFVDPVTCTNGGMEVYGDCHVVDINGDPWVNGVGKVDIIDRTTGSPTEIVAELLNTSIHTYNTPLTIGSTLQRTEYIEARIYVDTEAIANGNGSQTSPFNVFNDAKDYAEANGIYVLSVHGEITIITNFKGFTVYGIGTPVINTNGQDLQDSQFNQCEMRGTYTNTIIVRDSVLTTGFYLNGYFDNCGLAGDLICSPLAVVLMNNCMSLIAGLGRPTISMNSGSSTKLSVRGNKGGLTILDSDHIDDEATVEVAQGSLTFDATCVLGTLVARGVCVFVDNSLGATVIDETVNDVATKADVMNATQI